MGARVLVVAAMLALGAAPAANAAPYKGKANDGTRVELRTNSKGKPKLVLFGRYKAPCDRGYSDLRNPIGGFEPKFTSVSRKKVIDRGRASGRTRIDGRRARVYVTWDFEARRTPADRWRGDYETNILYRDGAHVFTECATRFRFKLASRAG